MVFCRARLWVSVVSEKETATAIPFRAITAKYVERTAKHVNSRKRTAYKLSRNYCQRLVWNASESFLVLLCIFSGLKSSMCLLGRA